MILRRASPEEVARLRAIADYQFGWPAGDALIPDNAVVGVSPATRRVREVYDPRRGLIAVLRANDYMFSLSLEGARRLLEALEPPRLRAVVDVKLLKTKSVLCKAVISVDPGLRPGDEVVVVDENGELIGVGRLRVSPCEINEPWCRGEAIRLRKLARKPDQRV